MRVCYRCEVGKPENDMAWLSKESNKGLCKRCQAVEKVKEELEHEVSYPGKPMDGFKYIKMYAGELIVCPYCEYVEREAPEDHHLYENQDCYEYMCQQCEEEFLLEVRVTFQYTSKKDVSDETAEKEYIARLKGGKHEDSEDV